MVRRALTRQTQWYQIRCSIFKIKDFICRKTVLENFGILTPGDPNFDLSQKNDRNDFEMIFRELSNAAFRFSLRRPGAEIMGGGRSNAPPPSRRWKIQRPSRARVKIVFNIIQICTPAKNLVFSTGPRLEIFSKEIWLQIFKYIAM